MLACQHHSQTDPSSEAAQLLTLPEYKLLLPPLLPGRHDRRKLLFLLFRQVIILLKGSIIPVYWDTQVTVTQLAPRHPESRAAQGALEQF